MERGKLVSALATRFGIIPGGENVPQVALNGRVYWIFDKKGEDAPRRSCFLRKDPCALYGHHLVVIHPINGSKTSVEKAIKKIAEMFATPCLATDPESVILMGRMYGLGVIKQNSEYLVTGTCGQKLVQYRNGGFYATDLGRNAVHPSPHMREASIDQVMREIAIQLLPPST